MRVVSAFAAGVFACCSIAFSQAPTASISGSIADSSGGVLIGATVTARNAETGVSRATTANQVGNYQLLGLQAGHYEISASQPKFTTVERKDVVLRVGDEVRIDLTLPTGEARESLVVNETTPLVQFETSATVVDERAVEDLPT